MRVGGVVLFVGCVTLLPARLAAQASGALPATASSSGGGAPAASPAGDEARAHFMRGKERYGQGDFDGAIAAWEQAYALVPTPELHFNIARAHEQAGHLDAAIARYQRYLQDTGDPADRPSVEATIKRLQEQANQRQKKDKREDKAADRLRRGRELYQSGQYKEALAELQAAFELVPSATLVYNMAKTREKLGDFSGALRDYRRYLEMEPKAPDRGDVEYVMRALEKKASAFVNELALESNPAGAEVYLDGEEKLSGQTPLTLKVTAGPHKLRVVKNGFEEAGREFTMPEDRPLTLTFDLRPLENVGWLTVECDQDGSHIFLDGTILALTPYKERRALTSGRHQVVLEHEGFKRFVQMVDVKKGRETVLKVRLEDAAGRSRAPLFLAPLLGGLLLGVAVAGAAGAGALVYRARNVVNGTRAWQLAVGGAAGLAAGAALVLVLAVGSVAALVGGYVAVGLLDDSGGTVTVKAPAEPSATPAAAPAATTEGLK